MGLKHKKIKNFLLDMFFFVLGSFIFAVSVNTFTAPNNIAPGGVTGLATLVNYLFRLPIGISIILINVPIFIWALWAVGSRFVAKTIVSTVLSSIIIDLTVEMMPQYRGDMLLTTVFGGLFSGIGLSFIFLRGATTGGTDLVANLIGQKFRHIPLGRLMLFIDLIVVVISGFVYGNYESPLYASIVIFISSKVIDSVLYGVNSGSGKMMFIISPKNAEIASEIIYKLERGVTELKSRGCYSGNDNGVLLCAVKRQEVYRLYDIIRSIDPDAFIIVGEAGEITGEGFREIAPARNAKRRLKKQQKKNENSLSE